MKIKNKVLNLAMAASLGAAALPQAAQAAIVGFQWQGVFSILDPSGGAIPNTSEPEDTNQYQTPVSGTLTLDTMTGAGSATLLPFEFFNGSTPAQVTSFQLQAIGDGMGGSGTLMLGNLLWNWNGNIGMPASLVLDAAGLFTSMAQPGFGPGSLIAGVGVLPASDGTYVGTAVPGTTASGELELGPTPIATTAWNTSLAAGCGYSGCMQVSPSGALPLVLDGAQNQYDLLQNDGAQPGTWGLDGNVYGIAGSPMPDGPLQGLNLAIEFTSLTTEVPLPAAVWLFGAGLAGLAGIARRGRRVA